ncbi:MAG TPA: hypothetical protein GX704_01890 [Clostridiales bacterium]|jgi:cell division protein FtsB|nr:hypothetical protein [Clostridiales bacterium]
MQKSDNDYNRSRSRGTGSQASSNKNTGRSGISGSRGYSVGSRAVSSTGSPPGGRSKSNTSGVRRTNRPLSLSEQPKPKKRLSAVYVDDLAGSADNTITSDRKSPLPITVIFMTLLCTALFMVMVASYVRINEFTVEIEQLQSRLDKLKNERSDLSIQLEQKNNLQEIQDYAVNVLGMVKIDKLAKKYITVEVEDKIEVLDKKHQPLTDIFGGSLEEPETSEETEMTTETETETETTEASVETEATDTVSEPLVNIAEMQEDNASLNEP